jgi:DNA ligase-1
MSKQWKAETLYDTDKMGRIRTYEISVKLFEDIAVIEIVHGLEDGQKQLESINIVRGKNIGRSNETTPFEQAKMDAVSKWNLKKDKGYTTIRGGKSEILLPMLAQNINEREKYIVYPCYDQPKLNGMRCLSFRENGKIRLQSRGGKQIQSIPHIEQELLMIMKDGGILDGELYVHGEKLQDITSAINNVDNPEKAKIALSEVKYYVYDCPDRESKYTFRDRFSSFLSVIMGLNLHYVKAVPTIVCNSKADIDKALAKNIADGYEGTIIRNCDGFYAWGERSNDLQKYKLMQDAEYLITGVKAGTGRYAEAAIFQCITKEGKTFDVNPEGDMAQKKEYLVNAKKYIGKMLTVRFQELTKDGLPTFGVGQCIRDYE